jgi:hypothetical protein
MTRIIEIEFLDVIVLFLHVNFPVDIAIGDVKLIIDVINVINISIITVLIVIIQLYQAIMKGS